MNRLHEFVPKGLVNQNILWVMKIFHAWVNTAPFSKRRKIRFAHRMCLLLRRSEVMKYYFCMWLLSLRFLCIYPQHLSSLLTSLTLCRPLISLTHRLHQFPDFVWTIKKYALWTNHNWKSVIKRKQWFICILCLSDTILPSSRGCNRVFAYGGGGKMSKCVSMQPPDLKVTQVVK